MKEIYIVSTPIGNLQDITLRALETLKNVDIILCEDPKHHLKLLNHFGIKGKKLLKITSSNEKNSVKGILKLLDEGKKIALVTNAGTPNVSDPGGEIVRLLYKKGIKVTPIPGASSLTTALSVSPIPTQKFIFYGFIPKNVNKVEKIIEKAKILKIPIVFFVPPRYVNSLLKLLCSKYPNSEIAIFKELTKINEEIFLDNPCNMEIEEKGELVAIVKV